MPVVIKHNLCPRCGAEYWPNLISAIGRSRPLKITFEQGYESLDDLYCDYLARAGPRLPRRSQHEFSCLLRAMDLEPISASDEAFWSRLDEKWLWGDSDSPVRL